MTSLVDRLLPSQLWARIQPLLPPPPPRPRGASPAMAPTATAWPRCCLRTIAWLLGWRRLRVRYERSDERFFTFAMLACSAILFNTLKQPPR